MPVPLRNEEKLYGLGTGFLKSHDMAGVGMPQFYGREIATGELAHWSSYGLRVTGDAR
jgi:hypothetical protein